MNKPTANELRLIGALRDLIEALDNCDVVGTNRDFGRRFVEKYYVAKVILDVLQPSTGHAPDHQVVSEGEGK